MLFNIININVKNLRNSFVVSFLSLFLLHASLSKKEKIDYENSLSTSEIKEKIRKEFGNLIDPKSQFNDLNSNQEEIIKNDLPNYFDKIKYDILNSNKESNEIISKDTIETYLYLITESARIKYLISRDLAIANWEDNYKDTFEQIRDIIMSIKIDFKIPKEKLPLYDNSISNHFDKVIKNYASIHTYNNYNLGLKVITKNYSLPGLPNLHEVK